MPVNLPRIGVLKYPPNDPSTNWLQVAVSQAYLVESRGDLSGFTGPRFGSSVAGNGRRSGGFVLFTYLGTSQCRCIASINRSNSRIGA
jgi:hypothetical protein